MSAERPAGAGGALSSSGRDSAVQTPRVAVDARLDGLEAAALNRLLERGAEPAPGLARRVASIIEAVRAEGDGALVRMAHEYDGVDLAALEVPREACRSALDRLEPGVRAALESARAAIDAFHRTQLPAMSEVEVRPGVRLGRRPEPIARVGVYAPGGRAAYPSSVLMGVVPARVAGVGEVIVCSPPAKEGVPPAAVLAACALAGADRVYAIGGAGAVAALAFGTASVPRVDKIVGPGNAYVTEAKRQLTGSVAIDCPAGPSEVLIVADAGADATLIAAEMIAQAEHDPDAAAVLVSTDAALIGRVRAALAGAVATAPRRAVIEAALAARGGLLLAESLHDAIGFAERFAPEHLLLLVDEPRAAFARVRAAGTVFLGPASSVAFGDYLTGANHVLPTAGLARAYSGLSTADFVRWTTVQEIDAAAAARLAGPTAVLAEAEGLPGHAAAARLRARANGADAAAEQTAPPQPAPPSMPARGTGGRALEGEAAAAPAAAARVGPPAPALRAAYAEIDLYDPGRAPCAVDLSDNTSLFGAAPPVAALLRDVAAERITRYPSVYADALKQAIAALHGVAPENVVTGCGSDDIIDSALRAFGEAGDVVAFAAPTFGMVNGFARMNAAVPVAVPAIVETPGGGFALDADRLIAAPARVRYLCRPNNPTGTLFSRGAVERVIAAANGVLLIDEAYADYAGEDLIEQAVGSQNTLALRTLSKAYGLAGLRVGYAVGPARLVREVEKSRGPYKVNALAEAAALAVLRAARGWVRANVATVRENRDRLRDALLGRGLRVPASAANFLLVARLADGPWKHDLATPQDAARRLAGSLRERGVAVRAFPALPLVGDAIRVSIGPWPMMKAFLDALDAAGE